MSLWDAGIAAREEARKGGVTGGFIIRCYSEEGLPGKKVAKGKSERGGNRR